MTRRRAGGGLKSGSMVRIKVWTGQIGSEPNLLVNTKIILLKNSIQERQVHTFILTPTFGINRDCPVV